MTDTQVQEGNKLIAEFMGGKGNDGCVDYYEGLDGFQHESGKFLKYHTLWDWLMPVVEKIEAFDNKDVDSRITIERDTCNVYYYDGKMQEPYEFNIWSQNGKIDATWQSIVKFIQLVQSNQFKMNTYTGKASNLIKRLHVSRFRHILNWYDDRVRNRPQWSYLKQIKGYPLDRFFGDRKVNSKNRRVKI